MSFKIRMHALYDHFPDLNPAAGEPCIECYSDTYVKECSRPGKNIALLLEPRSMISGAYEYVARHPELFRYIFTHDSELLELKNALLMTWGEVWLTTDMKKDKGISICTSPKNWCPLHNARLKLYEYFKEHGGVDCFYGDWNNPSIPSIDAWMYLAHYKFSIIIENDIDANWYTEKVLNCFSTKTIPIYVGGSMVKKLFNSEGVIFVDDWRNIPDIVKNLDIDSEYIKRLEAVNDNFEIVKLWRIKWKPRFLNAYGGLLEDLYNE